MLALSMDLLQFDPLFDAPDPGARDVMRD